MSCAEKEDGRQANLLELRTSSDIEIELLVPNENFVPLGVLRRAGNFVMQRVVDIGLPQVNLHAFNGSSFLRYGIIASHRVYFIISSGTSAVVLLRVLGRMKTHFIQVATASTRYWLGRLGAHELA